MKQVIDIFESIKNTSSTKEKQEIIKQNKDDALFRKCLKFLLDTNILTGISDKKFNKAISLSINDPDKLNSFVEVMDYLIIHNTGTDADISKVKSFINSERISSDAEFEFYVQMVTKKYRLGVDAKIVNKVIPGLIPTFNVMLGTPIDKCRLKNNEWISISRKLNGSRCAFVGNRCMTRQGKEYKGIDHIINDLVAMGYSDYFIDGELIYKNKEGLSDSESFQKGVGIAMSKDDDKLQLKLVVFDILPLSEFWDGISKKTYSERKHTGLLCLKNKLSEYKTENIEVVSFVYEGKDHSEIWKWLDYAEENDWEGIMINLDTPYECKRTKNLIKVKKFFNCDIRCTDIEEGSGRNKGTLGALVCDYKGFPVNVGSGFTDENRKYFWDHPEDVINHIVSVKYKEETKNKDGGISIQFPVFECIRLDKDEPSYN